MIERNDVIKWIHEVKVDSFQTNDVGRMNERNDAMEEIHDVVIDGFQRNDVETFKGTTL